MRQLALRRAALVAGLSVVALTAAACSDDSANEEAVATSASVATSVSISASPSAESEAAAPSSGATSTEAVAQTSTSASPTEVTVVGERDVEVTLTGPIAAKYESATDAQLKALGKPLTGDHNAGTRESGVVFQQFQGGVIIAKNDQQGTPAYIVTSGKIRDAWNTERAPDGTPSLTGKNGSPGPLGVPVSDLTTDGDLKVVTFEHGKVTENTKTGEVIVVVNGKTVPSGLK